jgi:uncharacterized protein (DUF1501 family)
MGISRRIFLRNSGLAMVGVGAAPVWLQRAALGQTDASDRKNVLVTIFQRGAADGLNIVAPFGENRYYELRPTIAVPRPSGDAGETAIDLNGFFGLNPALSPLKPLWDRRELAIVHAVGSPDPTRSHFDAQDYMESGTPGFKGTNDGWLNRALPKELHGASQSPLRAVSAGPMLPRSLRGPRSAVAIARIEDFTIRDAGVEQAIENMYGETRDPILNAAGREMFEAAALLRSVGKTPYRPAGGAEYPRGRFGESMRQIAQLIKADIGVEVAFADIGGWDHHVNEVGPRTSVGQLPNVLSEFGRSLAAFYADLGDRMENVVVVTMSEFGRTAKENGGRGTDHGHANVMFAMGGRVAGGEIYGKWPGLEQEQLYEGRDLAVTTDFRDVLAEAVMRHVGNRNIQAVFPGYAASEERFRDWLKGGNRGAA